MGTGTEVRTAEAVEVTDTRRKFLKHKSPARGARALPSQPSLWVRSVGFYYRRKTCDTRQLSFVAAPGSLARGGPAANHPSLDRRLQQSLSDDEAIVQQGRLFDSAANWSCARPLQGGSLYAYEVVNAPTVPNNVPTPCIEALLAVASGPLSEWRKPLQTSNIWES